MTKGKLSILVTAAILCITSTAFADKLCLQTQVNRKNFRVTNRSVVAATCPRGFTELADTSRFQGPAGAQGPAGIVNLGACRSISQTCNHSAGLNTCSASCAEGEFALQHAVATSAGAGGVCSLNYEYYALSPSYSNGIGAGIVYFTGANCSYQAQVQVRCCPTS
jgi:hypothetical protein